MKLRLRANTLRLRVTQPEVARLQAGLAVEETTRFAPDQTFVYQLEPAATEHVEALFESGRMTVRVPQAIISPWASGTEVGFAAEQAVAGADPLKILVEKDFACLKPRDAAEDRGAFPHPRAT